MSDLDQTEYIFFLVFPGGDTNTITVVDLTTHSYEKDEYALVNSKEYNNAKEAIKSARKIAKKYKLTYKQFSSRYSNCPELDSDSDSDDY